ncbi:transcriptional regulator, TetR family [Sphingopyxis sp. YR583]|jgi:AcrR family transcriptional regulator|uniref:TetR family transcriptional regulator n=1 Tax=Sphingopyxis sp. YR583 TaxID=1881047 RepID=UPI0008A73AF9|nr:TetR family transcriptional regulator [Sphingopyxis sp. YR583]SEH15528.1 transcriptional regulator, TetR family [Sphingopyxis sp. YR583]
MAGDFPLDPIIATFALHGLRKTSMEDVATALGVSRQALYNRHGSKGALVDWAMQSLVDVSLVDALASIDQPARTLVERLTGALDAWVGRHMAALQASPHGAEIVAMLRRDPSETVRVAERRLVAAMAEAIRFSGPGSAVSRAGSMAQALCWTARGLVHAVPDHPTFRRQLDHIVSALVAR